MVNGIGKAIKPQISLLKVDIDKSHQMRTGRKRTIPGNILGKRFSRILPKIVFLSFQQF